MKFQKNKEGLLFSPPKRTVFFLTRLLWPVDNSQPESLDSLFKPCFISSKHLFFTETLLLSSFQFFQVLLFDFRYYPLRKISFNNNSKSQKTNILDECSAVLLFQKTGCIPLTIPNGIRKEDLVSSSQSLLYSPSHTGEANFLSDFLNLIQLLSQTFPKAESN